MVSFFKPTVGNGQVLFTPQTAIVHSQQIWENFNDPWIAREESEILIVSLGFWMAQNVKALKSHPTLFMTTFSNLVEKIGKLCQIVKKKRI